jgi:hypothetical protein
VLKAHPDAASQMIHNGDYTLRLLFCRNSALQVPSGEDVARLLDFFPEALVKVNHSGQTPLHLVWQRGASEPFIRRLLDSGSSPVSCLCIGIVLNHDIDRNEQRLPYDWAVSEERESNLVDLIATSTSDAVCALLECVLSTRGDCRKF